MRIGRCKINISPSSFMNTDEVIEELPTGKNLWTVVPNCGRRERFLSSLVLKTVYIEAATMLL